jgi:hypothetical protein
MTSDWYAIIGNLLSRLGASCKPDENPDGDQAGPNRSDPSKLTHCKKEGAML